MAQNKWYRKSGIRTKEDPFLFLNREFEVNEEYERFDQKNDMFNRSMWDDKVNPKNLYKSYDIANFVPKKSKGFDHWDYAFRNASWHLTDVVGEFHFEDSGMVEGFTDYYSIQTDGSPNRATLSNPSETSRRIKLAASMLGSGLTGICEIDEKWIYSHKFNRKTQRSELLDIPKELKYAVVMIIPQDYGLSKTYPAALSGASTGLGYGTGFKLC